jgi:hypothetical protein
VCLSDKFSWANLLSNQVVQGATLNIADRRYRLNLIVMPNLVLDVIMGMNWMNKMGVVIDAGTRTISLKEPQGEGTFLVLPQRIDLASTTCAIQATLLNEIHVVSFWMCSLISYPVFRWIGMLSLLLS